jgi:hypothetical protein
MARWLYDNGQTVKHVDVRGPEHESLDSIFDVLRPQKTAFDVAGAAYLRWLTAHLDGSDVAEEDFDLV